MSAAAPGPASRGGYLRLWSARVGRARGRPRVYLDGQYLARAGFTPAERIRVTFQEGRVTVRRAPTGERVVSAKAGGRVPVIDITSEALRSAIGECASVLVRLGEDELVITPERVERQRRTRRRDRTEGALFAGGGLLTEAARRAGFRPVWAVEMDPRYARIYERNHPDARMFKLDVAQVPLAELTPVELLTIGLPCVPWSPKRTRDAGTGRTRDRTLPPEAHPTAGDLVFWALRIIDHVNPASVVLENVPDFIGSAACWILTLALERMGYHVAARRIDPHRHGSLSARERAVVVATSGGGYPWPDPEPCRLAFRDIMDPPEAVADTWWSEETKPWIFRHWRNQRSRGNGFASAAVTADTSPMPTLTRRYYAEQGDGFVVAHPTRPSTFRWLTLAEGRRLQELPPGYELGEARTTAGEVLGQGVLVGFFTKLLRPLVERSPAPSLRHAAPAAEQYALFP